MAKILMIDDDEALISVFAAALTQAGHETVLANGGKPGLQKAKSEKPDLILLDQIMPDIAGNDVLKLLKEDSETKNIPVAMLTNFGQTEMVQNALNQNAVDYILKYKVEPQDLVNKVKELLKTK